MAGVPFAGFTSGVEVIPSQFFEELLPQIDSIEELKVTLFAFYLLNRFDGDQRFVVLDDFLEAEPFVAGISEDESQAKKLIEDGLDKCVLRGVLLRVGYDDQMLYFLNSPKGRKAVSQLEEGKWIPDAFLHLSGKTALFRPNIFQLYEENIGALTPMIADILRVCEKEYDASWIEDAIEIAVVNNSRNWRYVEAILRSWKENGRD